MKGTLILAHRGASAYAPENTMSAFELGVKMGAKGIETDIHLSLDGIPVIIHDEFIDNVSNGKGDCKKKSVEELKKYDFGSWFSQKYASEKIPLLEELLDYVQKKDIILNIEIKKGFVKYPGIEEKAVELVQKYNLEDRVVLSSFNHYSIMRIKEINKTLSTGALYAAGLALPWEYAKIINAEYIHPLFGSVNKSIIDSCRRNNIKVNGWTINTREDIIKSIKAGFDGIITNYPDIAVQLVNAE
jgi:glycerophosphoryl diester phosphodiesterase